MSVTVRSFRLVEGASERATPDAHGDAPVRLRVAMASQDGKNLDAHLGYARRLMVYDVTIHTRKFVEAIAVAASDFPTCEAEAPDRIGPKVRALAGCQVLFALAFGPPAAARIIRAGIYPIKVPAPEPIGAVLSRVQAMLKGERPAWLAGLLQERLDERDRDAAERSRTTRGERAR